MNKFKEFFIAFIIYASTVVLVPQLIVYIIISFIGMFFWLYTIKRRGVYKDDYIYILFIFLTSLIFFVGKPYANDTYSDSINSLIPYTIFIVTTVIFSKIISRNILKYILLFIIIEVIIGIVQRSMGVRFFISPSEKLNSIALESDYLYYKTVYGLSNNSSLFAVKIFTGFLLGHFLNFKKMTNIIILIFLSIGLIITFNRTSILSFLFFLLLVFMQKATKGNWKLKFLILVFFMFSVFMFFHYFEIIESQFFRGRDIDYSGRDIIFDHYISFVREHPFFGNFFTKYWALQTTGKITHAHNSYLQTYANMGLILGSLVFFYIISKINKYNYIYILPILLYSSYQYGILWGVSYLDIIFFFFLFKSSRFIERKLQEKKQ